MVKISPDISVLIDSERRRSESPFCSRETGSKGENPSFS